MKIIQFLMLLLILIVSLVGVSATNFLLPDGNAPIGMQFDGNFVSNNTTYLTAQDAADITRIAGEGYNVLSVDVPMKWVWKQYTGVPANDFNWDGIDAICHYAYNNYHMYCSVQGIVDSPGYWVAPYSTFMEASFSLTKENTMRDFKSTATAFTPETQSISMWDNDFNTIYVYSLGAMASHIANDPAYAIIISAPNEGLYTRLGVEDTIDANNAWYLYKVAKYGTVGAMNTAYGTAYADWNNAVVRTTNDSWQMQYDWWTMKSNRAAYLYSMVAQTIKANAPNKLVGTIKITNQSAFTLDMGSNGAGRMGFLQGIDLNNYLATTNPYVDFISYDAYPDQADLKKQSLLLDIDYGFIKGLGDLYSKPIYLAEVFPTVKAMAPMARASYLAQQLLQSLAYVGRTSNLGIRGASIFSWSWSGNAADYNGDGKNSSDPLLSIKDNNTENVLKQIVPYIKNEYKWGLNSSASQIAICNNTNLDIAQQIRYFHDEPLWGLIDLQKRKTTKINNYYINDCNTSTETAMIINQINYKTGFITDLNRMATSGKTIIVGYRGLENTDTNVSRAYGNDPTYTFAWRNPESQTFFGMTSSYVQANESLDVNVVDNNWLIKPTDLNKNDIIFRPTNAGLGSTGYERATPTTGHMDTNMTNNKASIIDNNFNGARIIKFNFNTADLVLNNRFTTNFDKAMNGILNSVGIIQKPYDLNASYGWETDNAVMFNAFGDTNYRFQPNNTATYLVMTIVDNNTVNFNFAYNGQVDVNLKGGQAVWMSKDLNSINLIDPSLPVTSLVRTKIITTADNNIELTCVDTNGCRTINYKVDNATWKAVSITATDTNIKQAINPVSLGSTNGYGASMDYNILFDGNINYLQNITYTAQGGRIGGNSIFTGGITFTMHYKDGTTDTTSTTFYYGTTRLINFDTNSTKTIDYITLTLSAIGDPGSGKDAFIRLLDGTITYKKIYDNYLYSSKTNFMVYGGGTHIIKYYSQSQSGKTEVQLTYAFTDVPSTTTTTTMAYSIVNDNNALITLTCSDLTYGCSATYYAIDSNNPTTLYSTPFNYQGTGYHQITYYSVNGLGQATTNTTSDLNMPTILTIKYPKNEATNTQITERYQIQITGTINATYDDQNTDKNIYVSSMGVNNIRIVDMNNHYFSRNYVKTYSDGITTIQPYLLLTTNPVSAIKTQGIYSLNSIPNVEIKATTIIGGVPNTLLTDIFTSSSGDSSIAMVAGQTYIWSVYYVGALVGTMTITAPTTSGTTFYIQLNDLGTAQATNTTNIFSVSYNPISNKLFSYDNNLIQTISLGKNNNIVVTSINVYVVNTNIGGTDANQIIYSKTFNSPTMPFTNAIDLNNISQYLDNNALQKYDTNGYLIVYVQVNTTSGNTLYSYTYSPYTGFDIVSNIGFNLRPMMGCPATNNPLIPCIPLLLGALFVSLCIAVVMGVSMGYVSMGTIGYLFLFILGVFTYLTWVPYILYAIILAGTFGLIIAEAGRRV